MFDAIFAAERCAESAEKPRAPTPGRTACLLRGIGVLRPEPGVRQVVQDLVEAFRVFKGQDVSAFDPSAPVDETR